MESHEENLALIHHGMSLIGQVDCKELTPADKARFRLLLELFHIGSLYLIAYRCSLGCSDTFGHVHGRQQHDHMRQVVVFNPDAVMRDAVISPLGRGENHITGGITTESRTESLYKPRQHYV